MSNPIVQMSMSREAVSEAFEKAIHDIVRDTYLFREIFQAVRDYSEKRGIHISYSDIEGGWLVHNNNGEIGDVSKFHGAYDAIMWALESPTDID